jgi:hypothetical protein
VLIVIDVESFGRSQPEESVMNETGCADRIKSVPGTDYLPRLGVQLAVETIEQLFRRSRPLSCSAPQELNGGGAWIHMKRIIV